jgi:hypothetical protein
VIRPNDRIELAPRVTLEEGELVDHVRRTRVRLSPTAAVAVHAATPALMAERLSARYDVDSTRAEADAVLLCAQLNAALLANVEVAPPRLIVRWLIAASMLASVRVVPAWPPRRRAVRTSTTYGALASVARGTVAAATVVAVATALPLALVGAPGVGLVVGLGAALGLVLHETAHAIALRGTAAALIVRGVRVSLLHAQLDPRRERIVAAAGPLAVVGAAIASLGPAQAGLDLAASLPAVLGLHALGLTVLAPDGRKLCAAW